MCIRFLEKFKMRKQLLFGLLCLAMLFLSYYKAMAETIRWQDFEYWDNPQNWGWKTSSYAYPYFGVGVGYGDVRTILDYAEGSRVMEVSSSNPSVFNQMQRFWIMNENVSYRDQAGMTRPITQHKVISFNISERVGIEQWDQFEFQVGLYTDQGDYVVLCYRPLGQGYENEKPVLEKGTFGIGNNSEDNPVYIAVNLGRQYQDGSWHLVMRDMEQDIDSANGNYQTTFGTTINPANDYPRIDCIRILGNGYKVDNIWFHKNKDDMITNHPPKLQKIGPQFAQLFVPFNLLIRADDVDLVSQPVRPNGTPPRLNFVATIGGWGAQGSASQNLITRLRKTNTPTQFQHPSLLLDQYLEPCRIDDPRGDVCDDWVLLTYVPQYMEDLTITIRVIDDKGLSDIEVFPMTVVNYPVVNHPPILEQLEDDFYLMGSDLPYEKYFNCYDQDYQPVVYGKNDLVGSAGVPGNITFTAYIDGLPYYGYGPYQEDLIPQPIEPHIVFHPQFEGVHKVVVVARDTRGMSSIAEYTLVVANPGGWLNHSPALGEDIDSPQVALAGQLFSIPIEFYDPDLEPIYYSCNIGSVTQLPQEAVTQDPYAAIDPTKSAFGTYRGGAVYSFLTYFPGEYLIQITGYDSRGGWNTAHFVLDVQPWWSL